MMHKQIQLAKWLSQEDMHHMADSWLYSRSNHILEFCKAPAVSIIEGIID